MVRSGDHILGEHGQVEVGERCGRVGRSCAAGVEGDAAEPPRQAGHDRFVGASAEAVGMEQQQIRPPAPPIEPSDPPPAAPIDGKRLGGAGHGGDRIHIDPQLPIRPARRARLALLRRLLAVSAAAILVAGCGRSERALPAPTTAAQTAELAAAATATSAAASAAAAQQQPPLVATTGTTEVIPVAELEVFTVLDLVATDLDAFWIDQLANQPFAALGPARPLRPSSSEPVELRRGDGPVGPIKDNAYFCRPDRTVNMDMEGLAPRLD